MPSFTKQFRMKIYQLIFTFLLVVIQGFWAQDADILEDLKQPSINGGVVVMEEDSLLVNLINLQRVVNLQKGGVEGFKIQLYRGNDVSVARQEALKVKAMVLDKFPKAEINEEYDRPVWYVRMGSYVNYHDALKMRTILEQKLPTLKNNINIIPAIIKQD